ncbi:hypothetical protein ACH5RR_007097 [Cinchona calisaya]|uniref:BAH domain-containing protein n=1 Tax=Cinchona calisaya TaxID=153742 RepID=A0ABD3AQX9_9GENT
MEVILANLKFYYLDMEMALAISMANTRRFQQVVVFDDDDAPPLPLPRSSSDIADNHLTNQLKLAAVEEEDEEVGEEPLAEPLAVAWTSSEEEDTNLDDPKPIGEPVRVSERRSGSRYHYQSFQFAGIQYDLEDPVLLAPKDPKQKPEMAIIKGITQATDGRMMVTGQRFYRPEELEKRNVRFQQSHSTRELFYSYHQDEFPAESVMHKFVVHFIPLGKQIPPRKQHRGFVAQNIYYTKQKRLIKLKDAGANKEEEINLLVQKTKSRLGDLPDIEPEDAVTR